MGRVYSTGVEAFSATTIRITFTYQGIRCREALKLEPTPANLKRAANHRAVILDAIEKGTFDYAVTFPNSKRVPQFSNKTVSDLSFAKHLDQWLKSRSKQLKASTLHAYRKLVNRIPESLGSIPLQSLKRADIRAWLETLSAGNQYLANLQSVLRSSLHDAAEDGLLQTNPMQGWVYRVRDVIKEDSDILPFTAIEQAVILAQLTGQSLNLVQFAFWTGLRTSELAGLDWGDIDWLRGIVRIRRVKTQVSDQPEPPKNRGSIRDVKLLPLALEALIRQKQYTYVAGKEVFQDPLHLARWKGDFPIRTNLWKPALRRAGVLYRRPYQTRHTYASMMLTAGEDPMWVAQQMGHSDWGMIRKVYGKWITEDRPDAGAKAVAMFSNIKGVKNAAHKE